MTVDHCIGMQHGKRSTITGGTLLGIEALHPKQWHHPIPKLLAVLYVSEKPAWGWVAATAATPLFLCIHFFLSQTDTSYDILTISLISKYCYEKNRTTRICLPSSLNATP